MLEAVAFIMLQEVFHMDLVILLMKPYDYAVEVVEEAGISMILVNALGMRRSPTSSTT